MQAASCNLLHTAFNLLCKMICILRLDLESAEVPAWPGPQTIVWWVGGAGDPRPKADDYLRVKVLNCNLESEKCEIGPRDGN